ncbi:MAG: hypothetical protein NVS9B10_24440 [Nevskia sp.]
MHKLLFAVIDTAPCRRLLIALGHSPQGSRLLRRIGRRHGLYASFAEAWAASGIGRYAGHDHEDALSWHLAMTDSLRPSDYAVLYWLERIGAGRRIFDFGGNIGNLFYSYRNFLSAQRSGWTVYDLPSVIEVGRRIAATREAGGLSFTVSLDDLSASDILLISGSLHYWEGSVPSLFECCGGRPEHVLINRAPIHDRCPTFITVQRNNRFATPCCVHNARELIADFDDLGYRLLDRWQAPELSLTLPLFPDHSVPGYSGFYFRRASR